MKPAPSTETSKSEAVGESNSSSSSTALHASATTVASAAAVVAAAASAAIATDTTQSSSSSTSNSMGSSINNAQMFSQQNGRTSNSTSSTQQNQSQGIPSQRFQGGPSFRRPRQYQTLPASALAAAAASGGKNIHYRHSVHQHQQQQQQFIMSHSMQNQNQQYQFVPHQNVIANETMSMSTQQLAQYGSGANAHVQQGAVSGSSVGGSSTHSQIHVNQMPMNTNSVHAYAQNHSFHSNSNTMHMASGGRMVQGAFPGESYQSPTRKYRGMGQPGIGSASRSSSVNNPVNGYATMGAIMISGGNSTTKTQPSLSLGSGQHPVLQSGGNAGGAGYLPGYQPYAHPQNATHSFIHSSVPGHNQHVYTQPMQFQQVNSNGRTQPPFNSQPGFSTSNAWNIVSSSASTASTGTSNQSRALTPVNRAISVNDMNSPKHAQLSQTGQQYFSQPNVQQTHHQHSHYQPHPQQMIHQQPSFVFVPNQGTHYNPYVSSHPQQESSMHANVPVQPVVYPGASTIIPHSTSSSQDGSTYSVQGLHLNPVSSPHVDVGSCSPRPSLSSSATSIRKIKVSESQMSPPTPFLKGAVPKNVFYPGLANPNTAMSSSLLKCSLGLEACQRKPPAKNWPAKLRSSLMNSLKATDDTVLPPALAACCIPPPLCLYLSDDQIPEPICEIEVSEFDADKVDIESEGCLEDNNEEDRIPTFVQPTFKSLSQLVLSQLPPIFRADESSPCSKQQCPVSTLSLNIPPYNEDYLDKPNSAQIEEANENCSLHGSTEIEIRKFDNGSLSLSTVIALSTVCIPTVNLYPTFCVEERESDGPSQTADNLSVFIKSIQPNESLLEDNAGSDAPQMLSETPQSPNGEENSTYLSEPQSASQIDGGSGRELSSVSYDKLFPRLDKLFVTPFDPNICALFGQRYFDRIDEVSGSSPLFDLPTVLSSKWILAEADGPVHVQLDKQNRIRSQLHWQVLRAAYSLYPSLTDMTERKLLVGRLAHIIEQTLKVEDAPKCSETQRDSSALSSGSPKDCSPNRSCAQTNIITVDISGSSATALWTAESDLDLVVRRIPKSFYLRDIASRCAIISLMEGKYDKNSSTKDTDKDIPNNPEKQINYHDKDLQLPRPEHLMDRSVDMLYFTSRPSDWAAEMKQMPIPLCLQDLFRISESASPMSSNMKTITTASIPLIKLTDQLTKINVDIVTNTTTGLDSTRMVDLYLRAFPPLRPLCVVLKHLLRNKGVLDLYTGGITSYALTLMCVQFVYFFCPTARFALSRAISSITLSSEKTESSLCDQHPKVDSYDIPLTLTDNDVDLGQLLLGFLEFYGFIWNEDIPIAPAPGCNFKSSIQRFRSRILDVWHNQKIPAEIQHDNSDVTRSATDWSLDSNTESQSAISSQNQSSQFYSSCKLRIYDPISNLEIGSKVYRLHDVIKSIRSLYMQLSSAVTSHTLTETPEMLALASASTTIDQPYSGLASPLGALSNAHLKYNVKQSNTSIRGSISRLTASEMCQYCSEYITANPLASAAPNCPVWEAIKSAARNELDCQLQNNTGPPVRTQSNIQNQNNQSSPFMQAERLYSSFLSPLDKLVFLNPNFIATALDRVVTSYVTLHWNLRDSKSLKEPKLCSLQTLQLPSLFAKILSQLNKTELEAFTALLKCSDIKSLQNPSRMSQMLILKLEELFCGRSMLGTHSTVSAISDSLTDPDEREFILCETYLNLRKRLLSHMYKFRGESSQRSLRKSKSSINVVNADEDCEAQILSKLGEHSVILSMNQVTKCMDTRQHETVVSLPLPSTNYQDRSPSNVSLPPCPESSCVADVCVDIDGFVSGPTDAKDESEGNMPSFSKQVLASSEKAMFAKVEQEVITSSADKIPNADVNFDIHGSEHDGDGEVVGIDIDALDGLGKIKQRLIDLENPVMFKNNEHQIAAMENKPSSCGDMDMGLKILITDADSDMSVDVSNLILSRSDWETRWKIYSYRGFIEAFNAERVVVSQDNAQEQDDAKIDPTVCSANIASNGSQSELIAPEESQKVHSPSARGMMGDIRAFERGLTPQRQASCPDSFGRHLATAKQENNKSSKEVKHEQVSSNTTKIGDFLDLENLPVESKRHTKIETVKDKKEASVNVSDIMEPSRLLFRSTSLESAKYAMKKSAEEPCNYESSRPLTAMLMMQQQQRSPCNSPSSSTRSSLQKSTSAAQVPLVEAIVTDQINANLSVVSLSHSDYSMPSQDEAVSPNSNIPSTSSVTSRDGKRRSRSRSRSRGRGRGKTARAAAAAAAAAASGTASSASLGCLATPGSDKTSISDSRSGDQQVLASSSSTFLQIPLLHSESETDVDDDIDDDDNVDVDDDDIHAEFSDDSRFENEDNSGEAVLSVCTSSPGFKVYNEDERSHLSQSDKIESIPSFTCNDAHLEKCLPIPSFERVLENNINISCVKGCTYVSTLLGHTVYCLCQEEKSMNEFDDKFEFTLEFTDTNYEFDPETTSYVLKRNSNAGEESQINGERNSNSQATKQIDKLPEASTDDPSLVHQVSGNSDDHDALWIDAEVCLSCCLPKFESLIAAMERFNEPGHLLLKGPWKVEQQGDTTESMYVKIRVLCEYFEFDEDEAADSQVQKMISQQLDEYCESGVDGVCNVSDAVCTIDPESELQYQVLAVSNESSDTCDDDNDDDFKKRSANMDGVREERNVNKETLSGLKENVQNHNIGYQFQPHHSFSGNHPSQHGRWNPHSHPHTAALFASTSPQMFQFYSQPLPPNAQAIPLGFMPPNSIPMMISNGGVRIHRGREFQGVDPSTKKAGYRNQKKHNSSNSQNQHQFQRGQYPHVHIQQQQQQQHRGFGDNSHMQGAHYYNHMHQQAPQLHMTGKDLPEQFAVKYPPNTQTRHNSYPQRKHLVQMKHPSSVSDHSVSRTQAMQVQNLNPRNSSKVHSKKGFPRSAKQSGQQSDSKRFTDLRSPMFFDVATQAKMRDELSTEELRELATAKAAAELASVKPPLPVQGDSAQIHTRGAVHDGAIRPTSQQYGRQNRPSDGPRRQTQDRGQTASSSMGQLPVPQMQQTIIDNPRVDSQVPK